QSYIWSANKGVVQSNSLNTAIVLWTDTGAAWVKVVTSNACGTATSEQNIQVAPTVGLNDVNVLSNLTLYPNPTFGEVFIEGNATQQQVQLEVFNGTLQLVHTQTIQTEQGKIKVSFNTENLSNGLYFVKIGNGNKYGVYKLVVMR
ncbi:MAG: T9SS C-terminal target domain-containing protein, partial [Bacteroidetes bacterium]